MREQIGVRRLRDRFVTSWHDVPVHKAPSPGRSALVLALVLVAGVGAGATVMFAQRPAESRAAVSKIFEGGVGLDAEAMREDSTGEVGAAAAPSSDAGAAARTPDDASAGGTTPEGPDPGGTTGSEESVTSEAATDSAGEPDAGGTAPPERAGRRNSAKSPTPEEGSGLLGDDVEVAKAASGKLRTAEGREPAPGRGEVLKVRVAVEKGLPVDRDVFADAVMTTLNDPRGWSSVDKVTFARTDRDNYDFRVVLASPRTTDRLCLPLDTGGSLSCGVVGTAVLNFRRWAEGSDVWKSDARYRQYLVNHEVGHVIGHRHDLCAGKGKKATVMVQQTRDIRGCRPEPWPAPDKG
ncbi:hypothetical protein GCM10028784_08230 [Myceligenerans cantabricum]